MISVERHNVGPRLAMVEVADGPTLAAEGVEYRASCGCICIFGRRVDNQETTCAYGPCEAHKPFSTAFMEDLLSDEGENVETGEWIEHILNGTVTI